MLPPDDKMLPETGEGLNVRRLLDVLRRRKWSVIGMIAGSAALVACLISSGKPVYSSSALLLVEAPGFNVQQIDSNNPLSSIIIAGAEHSVVTQAQIINSERFLGDVYQALRLGPAEMRQLGGVSASPASRGESDVINITATSGSATLAARVATGIATHYVARSQDAKLEALKNLRHYLEGQATEARRALQVASDNLLKFQVKTQLQPGEESLHSVIQRRMELESDARRTQNELVGVEAELQALQRQLDAAPRMLQSTRTLGNPEVAGAQERIRQLEGQLIEKHGLYQAGAPAIREVEDQIAAARAKLASLPPSLTTSSDETNPERIRIEARVRDLTPQREMLRARLDREQKVLAPHAEQAGKVLPWSAELDGLKRAKEAAEANDRDITAKLRDLEVRERALPKSVRLLEAAQVPSTPIEPRPGRLMLFGLFAGLALGLGLAFGQEYLDNRIHSPEDAEGLTAIPSLGVVPTIPSARSPRLTLNDAKAIETECYRAIRTAIQFSSVDCPVRTLVIASSSPGEGKTITAINLATVMAFQGNRVILVDADLRRPAVHRFLELDSRSGLSDVLAGEVSLRGALKATEVENLRVLTCGEKVPNPAELLGSESMVQLMGNLRKEADLIVFDTPPCLPVTDAEVLASQVDGVVVVIEAGRSSKDAVKSTIDLLIQVRARVLGCVLNKIDQSRKGAYYHYNYYRGGYRYYGEKPAVAARPRLSLPGFLRREGDDRRRTGTRSGS
jgi:succinoglycan biosynthesis transport protein ExoP